MAHPFVCEQVGQRGSRSRGQYSTMISLINLFWTC